MSATDAYRIDLDTVAAYRRKLIAEGKLAEEKSSILIVVGRNDTGDLEAQVRGSRHAWDIRLISIDFLLRLMRLKEELDDPKIISKIRRVLMPREFTKVDGIIDLVFSAAEDVKKDDELAPGAVEDEDGISKKHPKFTPLNIRDACAAKVQGKVGVELIKRSSAVYSSPDEKTVLVCVNSREYKKANYSGFWFAFHPYQKEILENCNHGYLALGCGSEDLILLFPAQEFLKWLPIFHTTEDGDRFYWHVRVKADATAYTLRVKKGNKPIDINSYLLKS